MFCYLKLVYALFSVLVFVLLLLLLAVVVDVEDEVFVLPCLSTLLDLTLLLLSFYFVLLEVAVGLLLEIVFINITGCVE